MQLNYLGTRIAKTQNVPYFLCPKFLLGCTAMAHGLIPIELKWQTFSSSF